MSASNAVSVTPWGGKGGSQPWEFILPDGARLIGISVRSGVVLDSISFTYKNQEGTQTTRPFGGTGGAPYETETFSNDEFVIGISGRVGSLNDLTVITSLSIQTNVITYGPYGTNPGVDFSIGVNEGKFLGFYGRCGAYIDSLGVILQPKI
ncbi:unnamed protein product [Lactuca virosa]|uniref:Jacalin-type lectin domain-containing protein n=1 Tax=Lactuca virosa TaxID=75947 RepID=A0AAU9PFE9_9ASTR|nr:unnamed protein product [Lactuca virosa]